MPTVCTDIGIPCSRLAYNSDWGDIYQETRLPPGVSWLHPSSVTWWWSRDTDSGLEWQGRRADLERDFNLVDDDARKIN